MRVKRRKQGSTVYTIHQIIFEMYIQGNYESTHHGLYLKQTTCFTNEKGRGEHQRVSVIHALQIELQLSCRRQEVIAYM